MELWELNAREQIRDVVARYNAAGDSGRFDEVMALFWDDAEMEIGLPGNTTVYRGAVEIRSIFTGTADRWRDDLRRDSVVGVDGVEAPPTPHHIRHCVSTLVLDIDDAMHARGYCYFQVLMPHGLDHWGRYFDRYEQRHGEWKFARRRVISEGHN